MKKIDYKKYGKRWICYKFKCIINYYYKFNAS